MFVTKRQSRLVAMVPVGDDQFFGGHRVLDGRHQHRLADLPQPVFGSVLVRHDGRRLLSGRFVEDRVDLARRIGVQHKELPAMRMRVPQQFEAVLLGSTERALVAMHDPRRVVLHGAQPDGSLRTSRSPVSGTVNS